MAAQGEGLPRGEGAPTAGIRRRMPTGTLITSRSTVGSRASRPHALRGDRKGLGPRVLPSATHATHAPVHAEAAPQTPTCRRTRRHLTPSPSVWCAWLWGFVWPAPAGTTAAAADAETPVGAATPRGSGNSTIGSEGRDDHQAGDGGARSTPGDGGTEGSKGAEDGPRWTRADQIYLLTVLCIVVAWCFAIYFETDSTACMTSDKPRS